MAGRTLVAETVISGAYSPVASLSLGLSAVNEADNFDHPC